jgi:DNA polymerase III delta prime subunit
MAPKLVGFMGAPGTGKTTMACAMKEYLMGKNVSSDVCTEYAREFCFQFGIPSHPYAQYRVGTQQIIREDRLLRGTCEYIFSDSPVWLGYVYGLINMKLEYNEEIRTILSDIYDQFVINQIERYHKVFLLRNSNPLDDGCRDMDMNNHIANVIEGFVSSHKHILPIVEVNIPIEKTEERKEFVCSKLTAEE